MRHAGNDRSSLKDNLANISGSVDIDDWIENSFTETDLAREREAKADADDYHGEGIEE